MVALYPNICDRNFRGFHYTHLSVQMCLTVWLDQCFSLLPIWRAKESPYAWSSTHLTLLYILMTEKINKIRNSNFNKSKLFVPTLERALVPANLLGGSG
jgi:hypothetical protein